MELCSQDLPAFGNLPLTHLPASLSSSPACTEWFLPDRDIMVLLSRLGPTGAWFCRSLHSRPGDQGPPRPSLTQHPHTGLTLPPGWPTPTASRASDFLSCYHIPKTWLRMAHTSCGGMTKPVWTLLIKTFHYHVIIWPWFGLALNISGKNSGSLVVFFSMIFQTDWRKGCLSFLIKVSRAFHGIVTREIKFCHSMTGIPPLEIHFLT